MFLIPEIPEQNDDNMRERLIVFPGMSREARFILASLFFNFSGFLIGINMIIRILAGMEK